MVTATAAATATATPTVTAAVSREPTATASATVTPTSDLILRAAIYGFNTIATTHGPTIGHDVMFSLTPDAWGFLRQTADGRIELDRHAVRAGDNGQAVAITETEYIIDTPVVSDSSGALGSLGNLAQPVPVTMTIETGANGGSMLYVTVTPMAAT